MTSKGKKAAQRQARLEAALAKRRRRRITIISVIGALIVAVVVFAVTRPLPAELANLETFSDMRGGHLAEGEAPPEYNSAPPTSGRHSPTSAQCGIYLTEVPDPVQIHNLEHGTVIIQYQPDLPETEVAALQSYGRSRSSHIMVAPNSSLTSPVVITSWTRMLRLDTADLVTIDVYYDQFAQSGPEVGVACPFAVDESI